MASTNNTQSVHISEEDDEDFIKICDLVPDIHFANVIMKVYDIEAVIV